MSIMCSSPEGILYSFDENKEPVRHNVSDIQILISTKMEELGIDEMDDNYFRKVISILYMEYTDEILAELFSEEEKTL